MDIQKTKAYYRDLPADRVCDCAYCRNYIRQIRNACPSLDQYLQSLGADIEKPFETMPLEPDEEGKILYLGTSYVIFGKREAFTQTEVDGIKVRLADSYPPTDIDDKHFVIETDSIRLPWLPADENASG